MKYVAMPIGLFLIAISIISCASEASMQKYYIDHQEHKNFRAIDVPASVISLKDNASPEAVAAYNSLKKFNVLAFVKDESNAAAFKAEQLKVKTILKDKKYNELLRIKDKGRNIIVKYEGTEELIDEVYLYASDKDMGFALVRVLGNKMKPEHLSLLLKSIKTFDKESDALEQLGMLLKGFE